MGVVGIELGFLAHFDPDNAPDILTETLAQEIAVIGGLVFAVIGAEYLLGMLPRGTHDYARFIKPSELARWCRDAGLEALELKGMTYNPLTDAYRLGEDCDVNYSLCCAKDA